MSNALDYFDGIIPTLEGLKSQEQNEISYAKSLPVGYEMLESLLRGLMMRATGSSFNNEVYKIYRSGLLSNKNIMKLIPSWLRDCRDLDQFWSFIKSEISGYEPRRIFLREEFKSLFEYYESITESHIVQTIVFDESHINTEWQKAIERKTIDPEGAITIARTLLESLFVHILEQSNVQFDDNHDINELYKKVSKLLSMAPEDHQEPIFKQILSGVKSVVIGLASLRNKLGDAHGKSGKSYKPKERHSEFAVNLSGSVALFLYKTFKEASVTKKDIGTAK